MVTVALICAGLLAVYCNVLRVELTYVKGRLTKVESKLRDILPD
jgi:hypothetical protein